MRVGRERLLALVEVDFSVARSGGSDVLSDGDAVLDVLVTIQTLQEPGAVRHPLVTKSVNLARDVWHEMRYRDGRRCRPRDHLDRTEHEVADRECDRVTLGEPELPVLICLSLETTRAAISKPLDLIKDGDVLRCRAHTASHEHRTEGCGHDDGADGALLYHG